MNEWMTPDIGPAARYFNRRAHQSPVTVFMPSCSLIVCTASLSIAKPLGPNSIDQPCPLTYPTTGRSRSSAQQRKAAVRLPADLGLPHPPSSVLRPLPSPHPRRAQRRRPNRLVSPAK